MSKRICTSPFWSASGLIIQIRGKTELFVQGANDPGARAVEAEASRIAKRAAEALQQSRATVQVCNPPSEIESCCCRCITTSQADV